MTRYYICVRGWSKGTTSSTQTKDKRVALRTQNTHASAEGFLWVAAMSMASFRVPWEHTEVAYLVKLHAGTQTGIYIPLPPPAPLATHRRDPPFYTLERLKTYIITSTTAAQQALLSSTQFNNRTVRYHFGYPSPNKAYSLVPPVTSLTNHFFSSLVQHQWMETNKKLEEKAPIFSVLAVVIGRFRPSVVNGGFHVIFIGI